MFLFLVHLFSSCMRETVSPLEMLYYVTCIENILVCDLKTFPTLISYNNITDWLKVDQESRSFLNIINVRTHLVCATEMTKLLTTFIAVLLYIRSFYECEWHEIKRVMHAQQDSTSFLLTYIQLFSYILFHQWVKENLSHYFNSKRAILHTKGFEISSCCEDLLRAHVILLSCEYHLVKVSRFN